MTMKGRDKHVQRLRKLSGNQVKALAGAIVYEGADTIRAEAFRSVSAGSVQGKNHVRSKPGEAPNREYGDLQAGMKAVKTGPVTAEFRSESDHARPLEFGTSKMAARPHVRPARDTKKPEIEKRFAEQFGKLVKASG